MKRLVVAVLGSACLGAMAHMAFAREKAVYSEQAVREAEGYYKSHYGVAEQALNCAGFARVGPTRPASRNVVPGKKYEVLPHPAVKHLHDVDAPGQGISNGDGASMCNYVLCGKDGSHPKHPRNGDVWHWYKTNFGL